MEKMGDCSLLCATRTVPGKQPRGPGFSVPTAEIVLSSAQALVIDTV